MTDTRTVVAECETCRTGHYLSNGRRWLSDGGKYMPHLYDERQVVLHSEAGHDVREVTR